jgi:hypothetical protein
MRVFRFETVSRRTFMFLQFAVLPLTLSFAGTIPFGVDDSGTPVVSMTTGALPSSPHKLYIGNCVIKHVSDNVTEDKLREHVQIFHGESQFDGSGVSPQRFKRLEFEVQADELSRGDWLAIGPLSELVVAHESVDYFSATSELVLGSPEESFLALCVPESVARVPLSRAEFYYGDKPATFQVSAFGAIQTASSVFQGTFKFSPIDDIFEIGPQAFFELFADVIAQGLVSLDSAGVAVSTLEALDRFPDLTLVFYDSQSNDAGSLVLSPIDYIDVVTGLFRMDLIEDTVESIIHFNPLLIPDVNVRSTNFGLLIGKSINQRAPRETTPPPAREAIPPSGGN